MYQKTTLDNGLRIIDVPMPHTRSVSICIFVGLGSRYEIDAEAGISHFVEHLLFRGTQKRPESRIISEAIEGVGGILNGGTDKELTLYWCKVTQPHFSMALDVLSDILLNSKFAAPDIEKERQIIIEEINMSNDSPAQVSEMLIDKLMWPGHPLGRDIAGSKETVSSITRDTITTYWQRQYRPENTVISIAGNIPHKEIVDAVSQNLGSWTNLSEPSGYQSYREKTHPRLHVETKDTEQVHLCMGLPGLPLFHPERFTLNLINIILGVGMGSRLFNEVRDKKGLAYSIHSYVDYFLDTGAVTITAGVDARNLHAVTNAIIEQLELLHELVPDSELSKAKEMAKGHLLLRLEDSRSAASWLGGQEVLSGHILNIDQVVSAINAVTTGDIQCLAKELLAESKFHLAVVGPVTADKELEELLKI
ncbi:M16 family metallopeptidase [Chloroflexota bacterium]